MSALGTLSMEDGILYTMEISDDTGNVISDDSDVQLFDQYYLSNKIPSTTPIALSNSLLTSGSSIALTV